MLKEAITITTENHNEKMISIITPLYKGSAHIKALHAMIKDCVYAAPDCVKIEWIISNDFPGERIEEMDETDQFTIKVLNTDVNRGIQGARVRGLEAAVGDFVLFLDQDDFISQNWVKSQLEHIGNADACVCSATRDGKKFYDTKDRPSLDVCVTKSFNIENNWGFIPGQVLIRKGAIPDLWKRRWLKWNCCDDYLLWLLMYSKGCTFSINHDVLYDHRSTGSNQSLDTFEWYKSTQEMIDMLRKEKILSTNELEIFINARQKLIDENFKDKTWCNSKNYILNGLLMVHERNLRLSEYIYSVFGKDTQVAIYGAAIGMHVYERLRMEGIRISCFIDRKAEELDLPVPAYVREKLPENVNVVINTLIRYENEVKLYLEEKYPDTAVIHIRELLAAALNG